MLGFFSIKARGTIGEVLFIDQCNPWQAEWAQPHEKGLTTP